MSETDQASSYASSLTLNVENPKAVKVSKLARAKSCLPVVKKALVVLAVVGFLAGLVCGWIALANFYSKLGLRDQYDRDCKVAFDYVCKDTNFIPYSVGSGYFDHETGQVTNVLMQTYIDRGDCKIVKHEIDQSSENLDFCSFAKVTDSQKNGYVALCVILVLFTAIASVPVLLYVALLLSRVF